MYEAKFAYETLNSLDQLSNLKIFSTQWESFRVKQIHSPVGIPTPHYHLAPCSLPGFPPEAPTHVMPYSWHFLPFLQSQLTCS